MTERRVFGIDLGTTHTLLAFTESGRAELARIPQRASRTTVERRALLPSAVYLQEPEEFPPHTFPEPGGWVVGEAALARALEVPSRSITSSKSWLSHREVDRTSPILPWGHEGPDRLSPVDVAARVLRHVVASWNAEHPEGRMEDGLVVLTVPASFDDVARELTRKAAEEAGLTVRLIEEPQAAFYTAIDREAEALLTLSRRQERSIILVCDVGGGTTDFSLIEMTSREGELHFERVSVGPHLLLGGDNMDLAVAHHLERRLAESGNPLELSADRLSELVRRAREAKERLLSPDAPASVSVTLLPRGAGLFQSQKTVTLARDDLTHLLLEGFFPKVPRGAAPDRRRAGLVSLGLPFERDPAITRHLAAFLTGPVDAVLLNGGVFRADLLSDRLVEVLGSWQEAAPLRLGRGAESTSVALGAALHGLSLLGARKGITALSPRSYLLGVGRDEQGQRAVCVLPKGARAGERRALDGQTFQLQVGRPVRFPMWSTLLAHAVGDVVCPDPEWATPLSPLCTVIPGDKPLAVTLEAEFAAHGGVEVFCRSSRGVLPLRFDLKDRPEPEGARGSSRLHAGVDKALVLIESTFGKGADSEPRDAKNLTRELERLLGERATWNADTSRALADGLLSGATGRRRSADHERVFFALAGFTLRPGIGAPGDSARVERMARLFKERLAFPKESRGWQQWFVAYRRVAAGLSDAVQRQMRQDLDPWIAPPEAKLKKSKGAKPEASDYELIEFLAHLERAPVDQKILLGEWILERTWTKRDPRLWASIGRIGARLPAYASAHHVVPIRTAEHWLTELMRDKWTDLRTAPRAATDLARLTGDRARDVSSALRADVAKRLHREGAPADWALAVTEVVPIRESTRAEFYGEHLPPGLTLDFASEP